MNWHTDNTYMVPADMYQVSNPCWLPLSLHLCCCPCFVFVFWDRVSVGSLGCLSSKPPASASQVLGLQVCPTIPGSGVLVFLQFGCLGTLPKAKAVQEGDTTGKPQKGDTTGKSQEKARTLPPSYSPSPKGWLLIVNSQAHYNSMSFTRRKIYFLS
jgi:hypothetical protein